MSERTQQVLWALMAVIAIALAGATLLVYRESRRVALAALGTGYRIVYTAFEAGTSQLYHCDPNGDDVQRLIDTEGFGGFAVAQPNAESDQGPLVAYLRMDIELRPGGREQDSNVGELGGLYLIGMDGSEPRLVSEGLDRIWSVEPSWSYDGRELVFAAVEDLNDDGQTTIDELGVYVHDVAAGQTRRAADADGQILDLAWSPTQPLAIMTVENAAQIYSTLLDLHTGETVLDGPSPAACWSPDGSQLAAYLPEDRRIYVLLPDGTEVFSLDGPPAGVVDLQWLPAPPASSPDSPGTFVAVAAPFGQESMDAGQIYLHAVTTDESSWETVMGPQDYIIHISASPNGRYVACTLYRGSANRGIPRADLLLLDVATLQIKQLTDAPDFEGLATWIRADID